MHSGSSSGNAARKGLATSVTSDTNPAETPQRVGQISSTIAGAPTEGTRNGPSERAFETIAIGRSRLPPGFLRRVNQRLDARAEVLRVALRRVAHRSFRRSAHLADERHLDAHAAFA